jgi:hypothetical protein
MPGNLLGGLAGVFAGVAISLLADSVAGAVATSDHWVWEEAGLWAAALVTVALVWALLGGRATAGSAA